MVNVDHRRTERTQKFRGEHLHVTRQHDQFRPSFAQKLELTDFGRSFRVGRDRDVVERQTVTGGGRGEIRVVSDHRNDVRREVARNRRAAEGKEARFFGAVAMAALDSATGPWTPFRNPGERP